jgi:hypothetical protein
MIISEKNLKETCGFLVQQYKRGSANDISGMLYFENFYKLSGYSLLLIGFREKKHVESAIAELKLIRESIKPKAGNLPRPSGRPVVAVGQGGNL